MSKYTNEATDRLMLAISLLQTPEECTAAFEDLCTINEIQNMATRLEVAIMISQGINYQEISKKTGASSTTISRVARCYNYGEDGYKNIIRKLAELEK